MRSSRSAALAVFFLSVSSIPSQPSDAGSVILLADRVHAAFHDRSVDALTAQWSQKAPQRSAQLDEAKKLFAANGEIQQTTVGSVELETDRAKLRVDRLSPENKKLVLEAVKENGEWKVWGLGAAALDLAVRIAKAPTAEERDALLRKYPDLVSAELASHLISQGAQTSNRGDQPKAESLYVFAHRIAEQVGAKKESALALNNIGLTFYYRGEFQPALDWYRRSLAASEALKDDVGIARTLNNMGAVYSDYEEFAQAMEHFERSRAIGERLKNDRTMAMALGNIALIHGRRGDYVQALSMLQRSYEASERSGSKRSMTIDLLNTGNLFMWQNDYALARTHFERALANSKDGDLGYLGAIALLGLGQVAAYQGETARAIETFDKSLELFRKGDDKTNAAMAVSFMAGAYSNAGNTAKAVELFLQSIEMQKAIGGGGELALTYARLASVYNQRQDFTAALRAATQARELAETKGFRETLWRACLESGKAYRGLKEPVKAEADFKTAIASIENLRMDVAGAENERQGYFENKLEAYHAIMEDLVAAGRFEEAFGYAEQAKARVIVDALRDGRTQLTAMLNAGELEQDREMRLKLGALNSRLTRERQKDQPDSHQLDELNIALNRTRIEYAAFQTRLNVTHPQLKLQRGELETVGLQAALDMFPAGDVASLEFVVTAKAIYLFVLSPASKADARIRVHTIPITRETLGARIEAFRDQLANRNLGFRSEAAALYKLLLAPVAGNLSKAKHLVIVPDGVLWDLPFQALTGPSGSYLLDDFALSYAPSLTALRAMQGAKRRRLQSHNQTQLLAMGNPVWGRGSKSQTNATLRGQELGNLSSAETEVRRLSGIYGPKQSQIYVGAQALESRFKSRAVDAKVVHLATHGIVNDASPLYSHVLLAEDATGEDGLLEAWELLRMNLNAELVVLSACETARGRHGTGEGVIGLSWALLVSGVPTAALSQWKVASDSTSDLMVSFHANRSKGMSDAEAMRQAALKIRRGAQTAHPFFWAPFIVIGAGLR